MSRSSAAQSARTQTIPPHFAERTVIIGADPSNGILHGREKEGDFRESWWTLVADIETTVGCDVKRWETGEYAMARIGGQRGEQLRTTLTENQRRQGDRLAKEIGG